MIDSLAGLCRKSAAGFQAYIRTDLSDKFVDWLNDNKPEMSEDSDDMSWETIALDEDALLDFKESDNLRPLVIGRIKVGYARDSEQQDFYQNLLNQVFPSNFLKRK